MSEHSTAFASNTLAGIPRARARYLSQALQLEEHAPRRLLNFSIYLIAGILLGFVIWSGFTVIPEQARTRGEVVPAGLIHEVQHLEGGIVNEIRVRNGDRVSAGDVLVALAPPEALSRLKQMQTREVSLKLKAERLQALVENRQPAFGSLSEQQAQLALQEAELYSAWQDNQQQRLTVLDEQTRKRQSELDRLANQADLLADEVALLQQQVKMRTDLNAEGLVAATDLINSQTRLTAALREQQQLQDSLVVAQTALQEARQRRSQAASGHMKDLRQQLAETRTALAEVEQALIRLRDRAERLSVRAPVNGIVQNMDINSINAVINPGARLLSIVPVDDELIVEARVSPDDIGHIRPGQPARVKIDSFDAARSGSIEGKVLNLSPSTYLDDQRQPYYLARISLKKDYLGNTPGQMQIIPGMTVSADIATGSRTILEYLLNPIASGLDVALTER